MVVSTPPLLVVITGPSGVGKDSILNGLRANRAHRYFAITATTRPRRKNEQDGVDYHFLSVADFQEMWDGDGFLESATVYGYRYGVPKSPIRDALARGEDVFLRTDVQGATYIKNHCANVLAIFIAPPSMKELARRLRARGTDQERQISLRLQKAIDEVATSSSFDHTVTNDHLADTIAKLEEVIATEKQRPGRLPVIL